MKNLRIYLLGLVATLLFVARQSEAQTTPVTEGEQPLQKNITMNLFPNPSNGEFRVEMELAEKHLLTAKLFDMTGKMVEDLSVELTQEPGKVTGDISLKEVTPGIYFLRVESGDRSGAKKIVIR